MTDITTSALHRYRGGISIVFVLLLFTQFQFAAQAQQPAAKPAAAPQGLEVKIEFNRRVKMRDGVELSPAWRFRRALSRSTIGI